MDDKALAVFVPMEKDGITYDILGAGDIPGALECLGVAFENEPMGRVLGVTDEEIRIFSAPILEKACEEGLSVVARNREDIVMGVNLCLDWTTEIPVSEGVSRKFDPIMKLLATLDEGMIERLDEDSRMRVVDETGKVGKGRILHMFMLGVLKGNPKEMGTTLTRTTERLAKICGFEATAAEATGPISQHIVLNKFGYREVSAVDYSDFTFKGEKPFTGIPANFRSQDGKPCSNCKLVIRFLDEE
jgi:hypothetical protein